MVPPGPMAQAFTFRALGAESRCFHTDSVASGLMRQLFQALFTCRLQSTRCSGRALNPLATASGSLPQCHLLRDSSQRAL